MAKESTYGDHITLLALSRLYNIQFMIVSADCPAYNVLILPDGTYSAPTFLLTLGYFPEGRGEHYVSISFDLNHAEIMEMYGSHSDSEGETPAADSEVDSNAEAPVADSEVESNAEAPVADSEVESSAEAPAADSDIMSSAEAPAADSESHPERETE
ncbi:hypothetical protein ACOMHN_048155 [Nucella lapillus]